MKALKAMPIGMLLGLAACGSLECTSSKFDKNALDMAATLDHSGGGRNPLPHDSWTENSRLEAFLRDELKGQGMTSLAAKYGLQCIPSRQDARCSECLTCRKTVKEWALDSALPFLPVEAFKCVDLGEVLVQVDTAPDGPIKAMTYWRTSPDALRVLAEQARRHAQPPSIYVPPPR
jgi:hypothetical protein